MPQSRTWQLSQDANKLSGVCSVCHATRQLHLRDGTVHNHGPRDNPCAGSHRPPLVPTSQGCPTLSQQPSGSGASVSVPGSQSVQPDGQSTGVAWSPVDWRLIKHIPKSARASCAAHLASLLRNTVTHPEVAANWLAVFNWSGTILSVPKRGGKKHNLTSCIKKRVASFSSLAVPDPEVRNPVKRKTCSPALQLAQGVAAKLEDGNIKAAVRLLVSDDTPATPSVEGLKKLSEKHPSATLNPGALPLPQQDSHLSVAETDVRKAVMCFPAGSSGGPDGFRPQHLKDLLNCREAGSDFLSALTAFVNLVLSGHCPKDMAPIFFGGRLIALDKKSGGIRPIVIGFTLRRLVSKCANAVGVARLAPYFHPRQLGVGTAGGCEAAIHSARRFLESMPTGHVVVKLDFTNAFNCLHRQDMLLAIKERLPELYAYSFSAYSQPSILYYGQFSLLSNEGPQQGDPLGPLSFSNTVHPLLESMVSDLTLGYLDDVTLGGQQGQVAKDVNRVIEVGHKMGLILNVSKCELIADPRTTVTDQTLQSFQRIDVQDASLLGAPLFPGPVLDGVWSDRCSDLSRAVDRLSLIGAQDALILLRASFSAPRVHHLLRCSPSADNAALVIFDNLLRSALNRVTNSDLTDTQWLQATLPIKEGGLGVRRVSSLALSAFLASAESTLPLQASILSSCPCPADSFVEVFQARWCASHGSPPVGELSCSQSAWDRPGILLDRGQVEANMADTRQKASFLAAATRHSGDWLTALPIASCGLRLDDEAIRVAVALRLGLNLCVPHVCRCGAQVDAWGLHAMVCKHAPGRIMRHHALNDVIARAFASAGVPAMKEPTGLSRSDGRRPDGLTLLPWQTGKPLSWDVTVAATLADSYISANSCSGGAAAEMAATRKMAKYADLNHPAQ